MVMVVVEERWKDAGWDELKKLRQYKVRSNTLLSEKCWLGIFNSWRKGQKDERGFEEMRMEEIASLLGPSAVAAWNKNGKAYSPSSLCTGISALICAYNWQHLTGHDFWKDPIFSDAYWVIDRYIAQLQEEGAWPMKFELWGDWVDSGAANPWWNNCEGSALLNLLPHHHQHWWMSWVALCADHQLIWEVVGWRNKQQLLHVFSQESFVLALSKLFPYALLHGFIQILLLDTICNHSNSKVSGSCPTITD